MCNFALDRFLTGVAFALILSVTAGAAQTAPDAATIEAAIPIPEPAKVPPPTVADIGSPAPVAVPDPTAATKSAVPLDAATPTGTAAAPSTNDTNVPDAIAEADRAVADKIKDLVEGKLTAFFERKQERDGVQAFYARRNFAPFWVENGMANARAKAAIAFLATVDEDGLDPNDYPPLDIRAGAGPAELAAADLKFTDIVLNFARHAQNGRVHFSRVSSNILYEVAPPDPRRVLDEIATAPTLSEVFASYYPQHAGYKTLKAKLAELRNQTAEIESVHIPGGSILRPGMDDPRIPLLRRRLKIKGDETSTSYDDAVFDAVKRFQQAAGLHPDGLLGPDTLRVINGPSRSDQIDIIVANMERWRWLPRDFGKFYSMLNIPDFLLKVVKNDAEIWSTRVVIGKASTPTPLLSETMKYITVNPTWNVPPSIVQNEYLPALQQDPTVLSRMGIRVVQNRDGSIRMYQPPGEGNALGRLRFNFPNRFLVYQHDTPDKGLFSRKVRAYSHGCMRVQDPETYAEILLSVGAPNGGYTARRLRGMYGGPERQINFANPIPVYITYETAFVDKSGTLQFRSDIYGLDTRTLRALRDKDRLIADFPVVRREKVVTSRPIRLPPGVVESESGWSFFERLFR